jgi:hypothetical protein
MLRGTMLLAAMAGAREVHEAPTTVRHLWSATTHVRRRPHELLLVCRS